MSPISDYRALGPLKFFAIIAAALAWIRVRRLARGLCRLAGAMQPQLGHQGSYRPHQIACLQRPPDRRQPGRLRLVRLDLEPAGRHGLDRHLGRAPRPPPPATALALAPPLPPRLSPGVTPMPLLQARKQYKPFEYPWAFDFWKRQQQIHWMPRGSALGEDCRDWAQKLTEHERNLLTQIFRFFTQADIEVQDCYHDKYGRVFKPVEIKMMLAAFSNMETVHIAAYSHLLDTIGMPESEYSMFLQIRDEGQARLSRHLQRRYRRGYRAHIGHVRRLHRGAAAVRKLRHADELPALHKMKGDGPDRQLERARRILTLARASPSCSTPSSRSATA